MSPSRCSRACSSAARWVLGVGGWVRQTGEWVKQAGGRAVRGSVTVDCAAVGAESTLALMHSLACPPACSSFRSSPPQKVALGLPFHVLLDTRTPFNSPACSPALPAAVFRVLRPSESGAGPALSCFAGHPHPLCLLLWRGRAAPELPRVQCRAGARVSCVLCRAVLCCALPCCVPCSTSELGAGVCCVLARVANQSDGHLQRRL